MTQEKGLNPQLPIIQEFIESDLKRQKTLTDNMEDDRLEDWEPLNRFFREVITPIIAR